MTFEEAKKVSVYDLCVKFGAKLVQVSESKQYALFHAPYRKDEHPSLVVDLESNRWRDLAEDVGGDAVDFVRRQLGCTSAREALAYLADGHVGGSCVSYKRSSPMKKENISMLREEIVPLQNQVLLDFVASRSVSPTLAKRYCMEAHRLSKSGKPYFALAFPSRSGGYKLRNAGFKGAVGPKDISVIGSGSVFLFFEGFFDFFSHVQMYGYRADATYVVLNSTSLAGRAASHVKHFMPDELQLWLDNDEAGRAATSLLLAKFPDAVDMSSTYAEYQDLNDMLMGKIIYEKLNKSRA